MTDKKSEEVKKAASPQEGAGEPRPASAGREECEKKAAEYLAGWQRARADLLNYKKDEMERISELLKYANEGFVLKVLPILDNFDKAQQGVPEDKQDDYFKGFILIKKQLEDLLKAQGVEEIKTEGEKFDLSLMEEVQNVEEERKGYKINGRLLRPAKVKIKN